VLRAPVFACVIVEGELARLRAAFGDLEMAAVSIIDPESLLALRQAIWRLTGLIRVHLRANGTTADEPLALHEGATVAEVAEWVHSELGASFSGARIWGPSARFDGQRVGREHVVHDGDTVEVTR
jgi:uncharacterized protein